MSKARCPRCTETWCSGSTGDECEVLEKNEDSQNRPRVIIRVGDALTVLRKMSSESVHCCVSSPPYWGLRRYLNNSPGMIGLESTFEAHLGNLVTVFREVRRVLRKDGTLWAELRRCVLQRGTQEISQRIRHHGTRWRQGARAHSARA